MKYVDGLGLLVGLLLLALGLIALRRYLLQRSGGTVDVSLRLRNATYGRGWALGVGRYEGEALAWYRVFSVDPRPGRTVPRRGLTIRSRRRPSGPESLALMANSVVLECLAADGPVELAMSEQALTGFLSWLESAPPGTAPPGTLPLDSRPPG